MQTTADRHAHEAVTDTVADLNARGIPKMTVVVELIHVAAALAVTDGATLDMFLDAAKMTYEKAIRALKEISSSA